MILLYRLWVLVVAATGLFPVWGPPVTAPKPVRLVAGSLDVLIFPGYGARIASLKYRGIEQLFTADRDSLLFGSTVWTSPQSVWKWPPYHALDAGRYTVLRQTDSSLTLQSAVCPQSGFQFIKETTVSAQTSMVELTYTVQNRTDSAKWVALWEVTRFPKRGMCLFAPGDFMPDRYQMPTPAYKNSVFLTRQSPTAYPGLVMTDSLARLTILTDQSRIPKLCADSRGWVAYLTDDTVFVKVFADSPVTDLPPFQGEVEIFTAFGKPYIEVEAQSPYRRLLPGQRLTWRVRWYVRSRPGSPSMPETETLIHKLIRQS